MKKCLNCNKDITSLYFFTKKEFCSEDCEKSLKNNSENGIEFFKNIFGIR